MRFRLAACLLVLSASFAFAQDRLCDSISATTIDHDAEVIIQKVTLGGKWGQNDATVYLPDKQIVEGAVVFSHSSIHADGASKDLLPLALTLAHAGAAVIVPKRSLIWQPTDQQTNREGAVVICAEHWLIDHTKVFNNGEPFVNGEKNVVVRWGYAYVGPQLCDPAALPICHLVDPFKSKDCALTHYCRHPVWVPVGETEGGDNTAEIISDGGLKIALWLQRNLGLTPISALAATTSNSGS